jgi:hypothetical protein
MPIKKLSGLISRWIKFREWMYSTREICDGVSISTERQSIVTHELISQQQYRLQAESSVAKVEQVLQRGSQQIQDHGVVVAFGTVPPDERNTNTARKALVHLGLVLQLRVLGLDGFELDGYFFTGYNVDTEVDITY